MGADGWHDGMRTMTLYDSNENIQNIVYKMVGSGIERSGSVELGTNVMGIDISVGHFNRGRASKL